MVNSMVRRSEKGQAVLLVVISMSVFLFGALGMAVDGSQLFAQRQMAQMAADAAAQAGIVTIFNGSTVIGTSSYWCTSANTTSPCTYAHKNNFTAGATACSSGSDATPGNDCIKVDPNPGVSVTGLDPGTPNELQVTITRAVPMTVLKMVGLNSFNITARATAAILDIQAPVPILVTQPWQSDSFDVNSGSATIKITGGPQRSIQVNSYSSTSIGSPFHNGVDLRTAGPFGTGADFGDFGGPSGAGAVLLGPLGSTEHFIQPADPIDDPLINVSAPSIPGTTAPAPVPVTDSTYGCPPLQSPPKPCMIYFPGVYTNDINVSNQTAIFAPGIYYMTASSGHGAGFYSGANGNIQMASGLSDTSTTAAYTLNTITHKIDAGGVTACCGTNTSWDGTQANGGVLFYFTGPTTSGSCPASNTGSTPGSTPETINVGSNSNVSLIGSPSSGAYKGILFFIDHNADSRFERLGGGGSMTLYGTIYTTNSKSKMGLTSLAPCSLNQQLYINGSSGNTTTITGEIITSTLHIGGTGNITMTLSPLPSITVRQIALVNGE